MFNEELSPETPFLASLPKREVAVPDGYFEDFLAKITDKIADDESETPLLNGLPKTEPAAPAGYFDDFSGKMLAKIAEEEAAAAPRIAFWQRAVQLPQLRWAVAAAVSLLVISGVAIWRTPRPLPTAVAAPSTDALLKTFSREELLTVIAEQHPTIAHVTAAVGEQGLADIAAHAHITPLADEDMLQLLPNTDINTTLDELTDDELDKLAL